LDSACDSAPTTGQPWDVEVAATPGGGSVLGPSGCGRIGPKAVVCIAALGLSGLVLGVPSRSAGQLLRARASSLVDDFALKGWEPAYITWAKHPNKCWDVRTPPSGYHNGMVVQVWNCSEEPDKFIIPAGGFGPIRMAANSEYCLDAPGKSVTLQLWKCHEAPKDNLMFRVPKGRYGIIQPANDHSKCVDIPDENTTSGRTLQQWPCQRNHEVDEIFVIHWPVECKWGDWSDWSACSRVCKKTRTRKEFQDSKQKEDKRAGNQCDGKEQESRSCNVQHCGVETINFNGGAGPSGTLQGVKSGSRGRHQVSMTMFCFLFAVEHFLVR